MVCSVTCSSLEFPLQLCVTLYNISTQGTRLYVKMSLGFIRTSFTFSLHLMCVKYCHVIKLLLSIIYSLIEIHKNGIVPPFIIISLSKFTT